MRGGQEAEEVKTVPFLMDILFLFCWIVDAHAQGFGVIGMRGGQEAEEVDTVPVVSVALARLPGVDISLSHISMAGLPDGGKHL